MSENPSETDALDAFAEVLENVTLSLYAGNKKTNMRDVATMVLSTLGQFGWVLMREDEAGAHELHDKAIGFAKQCLEDSMTAQAHDVQVSIAVALRGMLAVLIEGQENSLPGLDKIFMGPLEDTTNSGPDQGLWGGGGARG